MKILNRIIYPSCACHDDCYSFFLFSAIFDSIQNNVACLMHKIQPGGWPSAFWHLVKCHHLLFIHATVYVNLVFVGLYLFPETTLLPDVNIFHFGMLLFKDCNATLFNEFSSFGCCYLKNAMQLSLENSHHWDVAI